MLPLTTAPAAAAAIRMAPPGADPQALPVRSKLLAGSLSGVTMTLATYPLDLSRTRVTADMAANEGERNFLGLMDCVKKTIKAEGAAGLYKGLAPSLGSIIPYVGIGFTVYVQGHRDAAAAAAANVILVFVPIDSILANENRLHSRGKFVYIQPTLLVVPALRCAVM